MVWTPHVTVAAVVEKDGKFLLVEEAAKPQTVYNQPAGHLEKGETLIDAVVRETLEETAWAFMPQHLLGIYRWERPEKDITFIRFAFTGQLIQHHQNRPLDRCIIQTVWLTADEIRATQARHRSPQVINAINDYEKGQRFPLSLIKEPDLSVSA